MPSQQARSKACSSPAPSVRSCTDSGRAGEIAGLEQAQHASGAQLRFAVAGGLDERCDGTLAVEHLRHFDESFDLETFGSDATRARRAQLEAGVLRDPALGD